MIREMLEELKLKKVANLVEIMQKQNIDEKANAFKKLEKMKITKNIGLFLIESAKYDYGVEDGNGGINSSLISLCFNNYYDEYTPAIKKVFKHLKPDAQNRVVFLLSSIDNESSLGLYVDLVLKYYSESIFIPVSNLFERPQLYRSLFPKLYKALKFKDVRNNILIILNDYLNAGVVPETDLKKNKKIIQDAIIKVFNEGLSYNFKNTTEALQDTKYFDLRFFLEISVNIESYVSTKRTKDLLDKLYKKNDNQLNLFILENYIKKGMDISKINLNSVARDDASRYPLFDMLSMYDKTDLIPKRYLTSKMLAKSDFYINFMMQTRYKESPKSYKSIGEKIVEGYKYYVFKFKYTYTYDNRPSDFVTSYLIHQSGLEKYSTANVTKDFIGLSGGYPNDNKPSLLIFNHKRLILSKVEKNEKDEDIINNLVESIKEDIEKEKNSKNKKEESTDKQKKKKDKKQKQKKEKVPKEKTKKEKIKKEKIKKEKTKKSKDTKDKEKITEIINEQDTEEVVETKKHRFHFSYILIFLFFVFIVLLVMCVIFSYDPDIIKISKKNNTFVTSKLADIDKFKEINGSDIYNQAEGEYYVLLFKKGTKEKNAYYTYINEYAKNNMTIYYVNLDDEKNKFLYENNDLNFTITDERFLKVRDKDFEYYVDGKSNIIKEMKSHINQINEQKKEEAKAKTEENKK